MVFLQQLYAQLLTPVFHTHPYRCDTRDLGCSSQYLFLFGRTGNAGWDGIPFAQPLNMGRICQHCDAPFVDSPYRVISEESGIVLLDLIVCHRCHEQAQKLGLRTEEIEGSAPSERLPGH